MASKYNDNDNIHFAEAESNYLLQEIFHIEAENDISQNNNLEPAEIVLSATAINTNNPFNSSEYADRLKKILSDVEKEIDELVNNFEKMTETHQNAYNSFVAIANSLFEDGVSVSKLIILIVFGYKWFTKCHRSIANSISIVMKFLYSFLMSDRIKSFVILHGGWKKLLFQ
uniref:Bak-3 n=1 Tax=Schmidtea mediterranea TaxID=79327 RepID=H2DL14_SCHMD|nr:bak-3 [Schmidtea mediterranea]